MSHYEFTFLVDDAEALKKLEEILVSFSGKKVEEKPWGKRLFSYPIDKKTAAEYYTWMIDIDQTNIDKFKQKLNYDNVVIRYLLLTDEK
ncbi:hypothetical protein BH09PAT2_BH09PAT2_00530 [soil metagenome]